MLVSKEEINFRLSLLGISQSIFSNEQSVYVIKQDNLKKNFSESAITKFTSSQILAKERRYSSICLGETKNEEDINNNENSDDKDKYSIISSGELDQEDIYFLNSDKNIYENTFIECPSAQVQVSVCKETKSDQEKSSKASNYCQLEKLQKIVSEMNSSTKEKIIVKAYKSKMKSKFSRIYETNSNLNAEKTKYKIFHKCKFPNCSRTFASSGWLKSHFAEHLEELAKNKFNEDFEKLLRSS